MRKKRIVSVLILLSMLFSLLSGLNFTVSADDDWSFWAGKVRGMVMLEDDHEGYFHTGDAQVEGITVNIYQGTSASGSPVQSMLTDVKGEYYFSGLESGTPYYIEFVSPFPTAPLEENAKRFKSPTDPREERNVAAPSGTGNKAGFAVDSLEWTGTSDVYGYEVVVYAMMQEPYTIHFIQQQGDEDPDPEINPRFTKVYPGDPIAEWPTVKVANSRKRQFIGWYVNNPEDYVSGDRSDPDSIGNLTTGIYHENGEDVKYTKEIYYNARVDTLIYDVTYTMWPNTADMKNQSGQLNLHDNPHFETGDPDKIIYPGESLVEEVEGDDEPSIKQWPDPQPDTDWEFIGWTREDPSDGPSGGYDDYGNAIFHIESIDEVPNGEDPDRWRALWPTRVTIWEDTTFTAVFHRVKAKPRVYVPDLELYVGDNLDNFLVNPRLVDFDGLPIEFNRDLQRDISQVDMNTPGTYPIIYTVHTNHEPYNHAVTVYIQRVKVHGRPVFKPNPLPTIVRTYGNYLSRADLVAGIKATYLRAADTIGAAPTEKEAVLTTDTETPQSMGRHNITIVAHVAEDPDYATEATREVHIIGTPGMTAVKTKNHTLYPAGMHYNHNIAISDFVTYGLTLQYQKDNGVFEDIPAGELTINLPENKSIIKDYVFQYKEFPTYTMNFSVALSNIKPKLLMDGAEPASSGLQVYTKKLAPEIVPGVTGDPIGVVVTKNDSEVTRYSGITTLPALTKGTYKIDLIDSFGNSSTYSFEVKSLSVTYNNNNSTKGTAPVDNTEYYWGDTVTVQGQKDVAREYYTFGGWNTNDTGTGTNYTAGNKFTITDNTLLYAKWSLITTGGGSSGGSGGGDPSAKYDDVLIECKDETGRVIHTHTEKQQAGKTVVFKAPELVGYRLVGDAEVSVVVGDRNTKVTFQYVRDGIAVDPVRHVQYLKGYPDASIGADGSITRAEAATILYRLIDDANKYATQPITFKDIKATDWHAQSVEYLAKIGIIKGYEDGEFKPDNKISRAEFAAIIARFNNLQATDDGKFADVDAGFWAAPLINAVAKQGWIGGFPDGSYKPNESVTRAQVASVINRMLGRKMNIDSLPDDLKNLFWDLPTTHWAYADMMEASIDHDFTVGNDGYEIWE